MGVLTMRRGAARVPGLVPAACFALGAALSMAAMDAAAARSVTAASVAHAGGAGDLITTTMADGGQNGDAEAGDGIFSAQVPAYAGQLPRYVFTYTLTLPTPEVAEEPVGTTPTTLHINELMASNDGTILDPQGDDDDWIELFNSGTEALDLGGMYLSDKPSKPLKWQFPADTSIPAGGYLLVWADDDDGDTPGLHTNFKLSAGGESVVLSDVDARSNAVIDQVDFPALGEDVSYGRSPEGTGAFGVLPTASPGTATPTVPVLSIAADGPVTEGGTATFTVSATPAPTTALTVSVSVVQGAGQSYLGTDVPNSLTITGGEGQAVLQVAVPNDTVDEPDGVLTATLQNGDGYTVGTPGTASLAVRDDDGAATGRVVVNELMASNGATVADPQGDHDDWIELYNTDTAAVDLGGMYLSDRRDDPTKWRFPAGTSIAGGGYLMVWADDDDDTPGLHASFKLSAKGESVVLADTDAKGNAVVDAVDFPSLARDESYGRVPDGTGSFRRMGTPSPGTVAVQSSDATLAGLTLSGIDFGTFSATTLDYRVAVEHAVASTAVTARPTAAVATVAVLPADSAPETGHQVALPVGETTITVSVTAENGAQSTYRVVVTRAPLPTATIAADAASVAEGAAAGFAVTLDRAVAADLSLAVSVVATDDMLAGATPTEVTVAAGEIRAELPVPTADDAVVEDDGSVTATLAAGDGYLLGTPSSATVEVVDDDTAVLEVAVSPALIEEGGSAAVTVRIADGVTFAAERTATLSASGMAADAYALTPSSLALPAGASSVEAVFSVLENDTAEAPRTVRIAATLDTGETASAELVVEDELPGPRIAGVAQVGETLAAETVAAGPSYRWLRGDAEIPGATSATYAPADADVGERLSVAVSARGRERRSAPTVPVFAAPSSPPLADGEEELLGTTVTLGRVPANILVSGFSRLPGRTAGAADDAAFASGDREMVLFMVNNLGNFALAAEPPIADASGITAYWNGHAIGPLSAVEVGRGWLAPTTHTRDEYRWYLDAGMGVRVAASIRAPLPAATVAALEGTVAEGAAVVFEVTLDRPAWSARSVSLAVTATDGALAETAPSDVAFAAGESTATLTLATADDAVVEGAGSVSVALEAGDGYLLGDATSASATVEDDDVAEFAVSAEPAEIDEGGESTVTVAIANGVVFAEARTIALAASGTASADDYRLAPTTLALSAGASSSAATLTAVRDLPAEPAETVTVAARHDGEQVGSATVTIRANAAAPAPVATLSATTARVSEGTALRFAVTLDRAPLEPLSVGVAVQASGSVLAGAAPESAAFAVGGRTRELVLATDDDRVVEGDATVAVALVAGDGYVLGEASSASAEVADDDVATFAVAAVPDEIDEGGSAAVEVAIANGTTFAAAQSFALSVSGTASADDYALLPNPLSLAAGASSARATLTATDDALHEPAETVAVAVSHSGAEIGTATVTIRESDVPAPVATLSVTTARVSEGTALRFAVTLDRAPLEPLSVGVAVSESGSALSGTAPASVAFAAGERAAEVVLPTVDDTVVEEDATVTVALTSGSGYEVGAPSSADAEVADDDVAAFTVTADPAEIDEGGSTAVEVSIANGTTFAAAQSFELSATGTASSDDYALSPNPLPLAAGASSARATLTATDDALHEPAETVAVAVSHSGAEIGTATVTVRESDVPSDDASLASLTLSDVDIGPFSPDETEYAASVPAETSETTVRADVNDPGASVEIADALGSTVGAERTVRLDEGGNAITATVTAEDGTTSAYRVSVERAYAAAWGERLPQRDVALGDGASPTGLWSDGETLWVVRDWRSGAVAAYALADGAPRPELGFALRGLGFPSGLWSDGTTLWAADADGGVTAHRLSDGTPLPASDLDAAAMAAAGNTKPKGLWSDGATLLVADQFAGRAYAYRLADGARAQASDVALLEAGGNPARPWGLWSDGATLFASDSTSGLLHGYRLADGVRLAERSVDVSQAGTGNPMGLWSDGRVLWVVDERTPTVHAYAVPGLARPSAPGKFPVRASSRAPGVPPAERGGRAVRIPDAALKARIAAALGRPADAPLGELELAALVSLDARGAGVSDLAGLEHAAGLRALDLGGARLADLTPLARLPRLALLNLDGVRADPAPLARLAVLERLSLRAAGLADARPLLGLVRLRVLDVGGNRIADLSPLAALEGLEALRADGNPLAGDAATSGLERLSELDLGGPLVRGPPGPQ